MGYEVRRIKPAREWYNTGNDLLKTNTALEMEKIGFKVAWDIKGIAFMEKGVIVQLHGDFEKSVYKDQDIGVDFWLARDLQKLLGYAKWENFAKVIEKAKISCKNADFELTDHFLDVRKMVELGLGTVREIDDIALTRYACYLIAQNGDPSKDAIAFAQSYFAVQTRKQEIIEKRIGEIERLGARKKLTVSEKELSGIIYERLTTSKEQKKEMIPMSG